MLTLKEIRAFSPEEAACFLDAAKENCHGVLLAFALAFGMRPEEYFGLQWKDVDWNQGAVIVQRALIWRTKEDDEEKSEEALAMISLSEFDDSIGLGIPYSSDLHQGGGNAGYFDLKKEPEKISAIHELKNWPELRDLVTLINHKDSFFRTLRCQVFLSGAPENLPFKRVCFSYTTVAFEILDYNLSMGRHEELRQGIAKYAIELLSESRTHMELDLTSTSYNEHRVSRAWSLTIHVWGLGQENEEARKTWAVGIRALSNFFAKECFAYPDELKKGRLHLS